MKASTKGRPKMKPAAIRSHVLQIRVTPGELANLKREAKHAGFITASEWVRARLNVARAFG